MKLKSLEEKRKATSEIVGDFEETTSIVKVNGNSVMWDLINDLPFEDVQEMCGEETANKYILQFVSESMISKEFENRMK